MLPEWNDLPDSMKNVYVRKYYKILESQSTSLKVKRGFDIVMSLILIILLLPVYGVIAVLIKLDSPGPVLFKQTRVTAYDKDFTIYKFRTMVQEQCGKGSKVTVAGDDRITAIGKKLRKYRLDELPQLINVLKGEMSFVGTRPEVRKYVDAYSPAMMATLLMPAGITSEASIRYKDEDKLLAEAEDVDETYIKVILPEKMRYNLKSIRRFSFMSDVITMIRTVISVVQ